MNTIIVEDARLARQELKELLKAYPEVEIIGEAEDGPAALALLQSKSADLLLLDIHLPGMNGFEVLEALDEVPTVIFTTAYDQYALRSFSYNALDYLLKPITPEHLDRAIQKALSLPQRSPQAQLTAESRVFIKDGDHCWFVALGDVRLFESVGNYTRVFFGEESPLIHKSLSHLEQTLDPSTFVRINRQQMVNLQHVHNVDSWFQGKLRLMLSGNETVEVSRRQSARIREQYRL